MAKPNILLRTKRKKALEAFQAKRYDEAMALFQSICQADRLDADARLSCGAVAGLRGEHAQAEDYCRQALAIDPQLAAAHYNLGIALRNQGRFAEACQAFLRATRLRAHYSEAMDALAHAYIALYDWTAAVEALQAIIAAWPDKAEVYSNLGTVYEAMGRTADAIAAYEAALKLNPWLTVALNSLGNAFLAQSDFERAEACYRRCLETNPADLRARSNLLMLLNYLPETDPQAVRAEDLEWGRVAQARTPRLPPAALEPATGRRLRVAYLSSDFREHSVASFIEPVLRHHDRALFEVCCYSDLPTPDATTQRIRETVDLWRDITKLTDAEAARLIRDDRIDILFDLAGHTGNNRLGIFAAQPAPRQVTWIGYPNTTGLATIGWRITDAVADPQGEDAYYSESLLRLPGSFLCYQPPADAPTVAPLPAQTNGYVTFGSFNNYSKLNSGVLRLWAEVLKQVPGARLLLKCPALTDAGVQAHVRAEFEALGVVPERLELLGHTRGRADHLALYGRIDIALDTFPYNGTTTTCEALWMGVPVVSLAGRHHAGRVGGSLLTAAGLAGWLADTPEAFVAIARSRADDIPALVRLRASLRGQVQSSPLCDATGFTRHLETTLLQAWQSTVAERAQRVLTGCTHPVVPTAVRH